VQIEGPLGKMSYEIPAYMTIAADEESRTRVLDVLDAEDSKQRAMWGTYSLKPTTQASPI